MTEADVPLYSLTGTSNAAALGGPFGRRHLCTGNGAAGFDRFSGNAPARRLETRSRAGHIPPPLAIWLHGGFVC